MQPGTSIADPKGEDTARDRPAIASARRTLLAETGRARRHARRLWRTVSVRLSTAAIDAIAANDRAVIVTGMGKSGHVGRKLAATLASTGTAA